MTDETDDPTTDEPEPEPEPEPTFSEADQRHFHDTARRLDRQLQQGLSLADAARIVASRSDLLDEIDLDTTTDTTTGDNDNA